MDKYTALHTCKTMVLFLLCFQLEMERLSMLSFPPKSSNKKIHWIEIKKKKKCVKPKQLLE